MADVFWTSTDDSAWIDADDAWFPILVVILESGAGTEAVVRISEGVGQVLDSGTGTEFVGVTISEHAVIESGQSADAVVASVLSTVYESAAAADEVVIGETAWVDTIDTVWVDADDVWVPHEEIETEEILVTDSGTGTDAVFVAYQDKTVLIQESGTGSDAVELRAFVFTDTADAFVFVDDADFEWVEHETITFVGDSGTFTEVVGLAAGIIVSDSAAGSEQIVVLPTLIKQVLDSGTGSDAVLAIAAIQITDSAAATEQLPLGVAGGVGDSAAGTDTVAALILAVVVTDAGQGTDTLELPAVLIVYDSLAGIDFVGDVAVSAQGTDSGTGTDVVALAVPVIITDSGTSTDVILTLTNPAIEDSLSGIDALVIAVASVVVADSAYGVDLVVRTSEELKQAIDSGEGTEAEIIQVAAGAADSGTGTDAVDVPVAVVIEDSAVGSDAVISMAAVVVADAGQGTEQIGVPTAASVVVADSSVGTEAIPITISAGVVDSAIGSDVPVASEYVVPRIIADLGVGTDALSIAAATVVYDSALSSEQVGRGLYEIVVLEDLTGSDAISSVRPYEVIWMVSSRYSQIVADSGRSSGITATSNMSAKMIVGNSMLKIQRVA